MHKIEPNPITSENWNQILFNLVGLDLYLVLFFIVLFFSLILAKIKENIEPFGSKILKLPEIASPRRD